MNGRTLHLVDLENLAATSRLDRPTAEAAVMAYRRRIAVRDGDHIVVADDVYNAVAAGLACLVLPLDVAVPVTRAA